MTSLSDYLELAAGVVLVCGAGIGLVFYRKQPNKISTKVIQSAGACASPATAERQRPKNQLQIRSAEALLAMTETQGLVETHPRQRIAPSRTTWWPVTAHIRGGCECAGVEGRLQTPYRRCA